MSSQDVKASNSAQDEINDNAESLLLDDTHFNPLLYQEESLSLTDRTGTTAADEVIPSKVQFKPENDDSEEEYKLCGYLFMVASVGKTFVPGIKGRRNSVRKRWFVYSHKTCKLYYYKDKSGTEPLGTIDIVLATFIYDPEIKSQGQFTIQCGNEEYILEATNAQGRLYWLQQLQTARREFSQRRTTTLTSACKTTSNARPESGLLQVSGSYEYIPDPHRDLMTQVSRPSDPLRSNLQNKSPNSPLTEARSAISNFLPATHKKMFRPISESPRSPISPRSSRPLSMSSLSPLTSPTEDLSLGRIGRKLRNSMRVRRSSSFDEKDGESPLSPTCRRCRELHKELLSYREDLAATQDECGASREIINLLQKELDTLQQEKATLITLDRSDLTDDHILDILRIKDHRIIDLEHQNQQMTNEIAKIRDKIGSSQSHQEHLSEKIDMLTDLIEAKDAAIVHLTHKNCEDNSQGSSVDSLIVYEKISRGSQTTDQERDALKDALEAYRSQNTFLNKEILELNLLRKQASEREQRLIRESSEWEAKFYQIQSKYLLLLNELHSPSASQHDPAILTQLLQDVVQNHGAPDLRKIRRRYSEFGPETKPAEL